MLFDTSRFRGELARFATLLAHGKILANKWNVLYFRNTQSNPSRLLSRLSSSSIEMYLPRTQHFTLFSVLLEEILKIELKYF